MDCIRRLVFVFGWSVYEYPIMLVFVCSVLFCFGVINRPVYHVTCLVEFQQEQHAILSQPGAAILSARSHPQ